MKELIKKIEQWAIDREIDKKGTIEGQSIKTAEEIAELIKGISKDNMDLIKDSIGDVFITLVIGNMLKNNYNLEEKNKRVKDPAYIGDKKGLIKLLASNIINTIESPYDSRTITGTLKNLNIVSNYYSLDFKDCVESAYSEIANRKGEMIDGTFIKYVKEQEGGRNDEGMGSL